MGIKATCHKFRKTSGTQPKKKRKKKKELLGLGFGEGGG
jgi:hypothetical protein